MFRQSAENMHAYKGEVAESRINKGDWAPNHNKKISKKVLTPGSRKAIILEHAESDSAAGSAPKTNFEKNLKKVLTGNKRDGNILNCASRE